MLTFIDGALMMSMAAAGLFFLRFWRRTRDRLFLMFAVAFFALSANRLWGAILYVRSAGGDSNERQWVIYVVRLIAFLLILLAIIDKNRKLQNSPPPTKL